MKIVRTVAAFVTLFALSGAVLIAPSAVAKNPKVSVQVKTSNQAALNSSKGLMVMVKASGKTTVTVKATGDGKGNAFKSQKVKFGKKGSKSVKLALTSAGRFAEIPWRRAAAPGDSCQ